MKKVYNRRHFLRGTLHGASISLMMPLLPSLLPRKLWAQQAASNKGLIIMYMPDGSFAHSIKNGTLTNDYSMEAWHPAARGALTANLPVMLKSLNANLSLIHI